MIDAEQTFGGNWTDEKLQHILKYLKAYTKIMSKGNYRFAYIDAFAGTGYRTLKQDDSSQELLLPEFAEPDSLRFLAGSARIALQVTPRFTKYIFIERDQQKAMELAQLRSEFPEAAQDIVLVNADCNAYLQDLCLRYQWKKNRAVLFLDPFGMQVKWSTIEAIAQTKAIDLWLLFPLGVAVNRVLRKDGQINQLWRQSLDELFGASDWFEKFYRFDTVQTLFGASSSFRKVANFDAIEEYFMQRLRSIFAGVAKNPLRLYNSKRNPLYLLCFAVGNPKGAPTALRIAEHILGR